MPNKPAPPQSRDFSQHYVRAVLAKLRNLLPPEIYSRVHQAALPSAGGSARAAAIRSAREAKGTHLDPARQQALNALAQAGPPPAPPGAQQPAAAAVAKAEATDLPPDVLGAIYELAEQAGFVDSGEDESGELADVLPADALGAIYELAEWAGLCGDDDEAEPVAIQKDVTGADLGGNPANTPPLKNVAVRYTQGADDPHAYADTNGDGKCDLCGMGSGAGVHAKRLQKAEIESDVVWIQKSADQKENLVYGVVLVPNLRDSHGHQVRPEEIEKACHRFALKYAFSKAQMKDDHNKSAAAVPVENFIAPVDFPVTRPDGTQVMVRKGSWVMANKILDPELMASIERGERTGLSVSGEGWQVPVEVAA